MWRCLSAISVTSVVRLQWDYCIDKLVTLAVQSCRTFIRAVALVHFSKQ